MIVTVIVIQISAVLAYATVKVASGR